MSEVEVVGLKEFLRKLREADDRWAPELKAAHRKVADRAVDWAQFSAIGSGTRQQQQASDRIKGRGFPDRATIGVYNAGLTQYALGAFYGGSKRHGWFSDFKYNHVKKRQFPEWVGQTWEVGGDGGPYHINSSLRDHMDDILDFFTEVIDETVKQPFPN